MKEYVETISDSFVDYAGKTHYFTIAAISSLLPRNSKELGMDESLEDRDVTYEVSNYIEDYGTQDYLCNVTKALRLGISICNPTDEFSETIGAFKAIARARENKPALLSVNPGTINTRVVKALLEQEAEYIKNNPANFIKGYSEMEATYKKNLEMKKLSEDFTDIEKTIVEKVQENSKFLNRIKEYINWFTNQKKGNAKTN